MISIMIDHKLEQLEKTVGYTYDFIFGTLGFPYRFIDTLDYNRRNDIVFLCSLIMPSKEELISISSKGAVLFTQIEPELLMPEKLSKDYIKDRVREITLFNTFPVISQKGFDNPVEVTRGPAYYWGEINFDVIGNIFFHIAGLDELIGGELDEKGRIKDESLSFLSYARVAYVNNLLWIIDSFIKDIIEDDPFVSMAANKIKSMAPRPGCNENELDTKQPGDGLTKRTKSSENAKVLHCQLEIQNEKQKDNSSSSLRDNITGSSSQRTKDGWRDSRESSIHKGAGINSNKSQAANNSLWTAKKEFWPGGEDFGYCITHNVDRLEKWNFGKIVNSLLSSLYLAAGFKFAPLFRNTGEIIAYLITNKEYYWRFEDIREILNKYSQKATWFVGAVNEGESTAVIDYVFDDADLKDSLRDIISDKNEVALLLDNQKGESGKSLAEVTGQKKRLSDFFTGRIKGMRSATGDMDSSTADTYLHKMGMSYDASKSFIHQAGFKNGMAVPYTIFKPGRLIVPRQSIGTMTGGESRGINGANNKWEIPLMFCDSFLKLNEYKHVSYDKAIDIVKNLVKTIKETNGILTFNFSVSSFHDIKYLPKLMEYCLNLLKNNRAFSGTMAEIAEWWTKRDQVKLIIEDNNLILSSAENIDQLTITVFGHRKLEQKNIKGAKSIIRSNRITLIDIRKNKEVVIHCPPDYQQSIWD